MLIWITMLHSAKRSPTAPSRSLQIHTAFFFCFFFFRSPFKYSQLPSDAIMYCSKYSHRELVRELKLQSLRRGDILQLQSFQFEASAKKNNKIETWNNRGSEKKGLELMFAGSCKSSEAVCFEQTWMAVKITAAGWNGSSEVFILSFGTQLDHPLGPVFCFTDADIHTYSKARTLGPARPTRWPFCYLLLASFVCVDHLETPFCCCRFGDTLKGGGGASQQNSKKCTSWPVERKKKGLLNHKMNNWCKRWILKTKKKNNNCLFQNSEQLKMCAGR